MEYWGYKADDGLILQTDPCHPYKNISQSIRPSIPAFQYSIIPLPLAADSRHSRGALTWPRGPGFLRQNKEMKLVLAAAGLVPVSLMACVAKQAQQARSDHHCMP